MKSEEWNPGKLLGISGSYWQGCTLHAAIKLDLFTVIGDRQLSGNELAKELKGDVRATTMLLNALAAMQLLTSRNNKYSNSPAAKIFLCKDSAKYVGYMIMHHHHLVESWSRLDEAVKAGRPVRTRVSQSDEVRRESFLMGMFNMAMNLAPIIVKQVDLKSRRRLLDLGGGPGTYAIHFCLNNPDLGATVYDLPTTKPFAEKTIGNFGLNDRIAFVPGNYVDGPIPGTYDAAWLSHILHGEGPEDCEKIIEKTVSALESGGMILIHDFILNNGMDGPLFPALFSLNMLLGTASGQSYSEEQLTQMLRKAGVKEIRRIPVQTPNDSGIIAGTV